MYKTMLRSLSIGSLALATAVNANAELKDTTFKFGGYIKLDMLFSQYSDGQRAASPVGEELIVPSLIPVDATGADEKGDNNYDSTARFSRFFLQSTTPTDAGNITAHVEMDFFGDDARDERTSARANTSMRHAFFKWQKSETSAVVAGHTWTVFLNLGALPEAVDFVGPTSGIILVRNSQIRHESQMGGGKFLVSLENPSNSFYDGETADAAFPLGNDEDSNSHPDIVFRYDGKMGDFSYAAAGMVREIRYAAGTTDESEETFATSLSGKYALGNGDDIKFMYNYGTLGRYMAFNVYRDAAVMDDGSIETITSSGGYLAYRHLWSDKLRSTVAYATSSADNPDIAADVTKTATNSYVNLMYSPTKKLTYGGEYMMASRELESGEDGDLTRIQFTAKYVF